MNFPDGFCCLLASVLYMTSSVQSQNLVWSDEFDGESIDGSKWNFDNGDGCPDSCNWGNNELQWYQESNAYLQDGNLVIEAKKENAGGKEYTSAKLTTKDKGDWKFGKVEVRARLPEGQGIWPAVWMLPTAGGSWPQTGEIDIMELIGSKASEVVMTLHYGDNKEKRFTEDLPDGKKFSEDFHTFALDWKENEIQFLVDGEVKGTVNSDEVTSDGGSAYPFNEQFYLILNVAVGGNWPGSPNDETQFPQKMEIDYVRIYQ